MQTVDRSAALRDTCARHDPDITIGCPTRSNRPPEDRSFECLTVSKALLRTAFLPGLDADLAKPSLRHVKEGLLTQPEGVGDHIGFL